MRCGLRGLLACIVIGWSLSLACGLARAQIAAPQITLQEIASVCSGLQTATASGGRGKIGSSGGFEFEVSGDNELKIIQSGQLISKIDKVTYQDYTKCISELAVVLSKPHRDADESESIKNILKNINVQTAQQTLDRVVREKDGSDQGQIEAIKSLIVRGYKFDGVNFSGVSFKGASINDLSVVKSKLHATDWSNANLNDSNFSYSGLRFADIRNGRFSDTNLSEVYAPFIFGTGASIEGSTVKAANFFGSDLRDTTFKKSNLAGASFAFADLRHADFQDADLRGTYFVGAVLTNANFQGATFGNTDVSGASLSGVVLTKEQAKDVCGESSGKIRWRIDLLEQWESNKYSTGYEFEKIINMLDDFEWPKVPNIVPCSGPKASAAGFDREFPGEIGLALDRDYVSKGTRRQQYQDRVRELFELISKHWGRADNAFSIR